MNKKMAYTVYGSDKLYTTKKAVAKPSHGMLEILYTAADGSTCIEKNKLTANGLLLREQAFLHANGELSADKSWYPEGCIAKYAQYQIVNGQRMRTGFTTSDYGGTTFREIEIDGAFVKDGLQTTVTNYKSEEYWQAGRQQGIKTEERMPGKKIKTYYWDGKRTPQPVWWLKQNTQDMRVKNLGQSGTWKNLAKALFGKNKNPETHYVAGQQLSVTP